MLLLVCFDLLQSRPATFSRHGITSRLKYSDINRRPFSIRGLNPIKENLSSIRVALHEWPIFTNTLARFLYHFNELHGRIKGHAIFAFEQHLSFTALHGNKLFGKVAAKLNATPADLSLALDHPMTRRGLEIINTILQSFDGSSDDKQRRQTWKYARLFDEEKFVDLQTGNCRELTFILAMILKGIDENEGAGEMAYVSHIQNSYRREFLRDFLNQVASNIIQQFAPNRRKL